jgi:hypothetical protein
LKTYRDGRSDLFGSLLQQFGKRTSSQRKPGFASASRIGIGIGLALVLVLSASPAWAKTTRVVEASFGGGELSLTANSGVAVDNTTHDVYVADTGHGNVAEFEPDGTSVRTFGSLTTPTFIAIDNSAGASQGSVYVVDASDNSISKFSATGTSESSWGTAGKLGGFGTIAGIAVGPTGTLYALEESSTVSTYTPAGVAGATFVAPRGTSVAGLAADSLDNLYKVDASPEVTKFSNSGTTISNNLTGRADTIALGVNLTGDDLYMINGNSGSPIISVTETECGEECAPKEFFGEGELANPSSVAVDAGTEAIYVNNAGSSQVELFGSPVFLPDATTEAATEVTRFTATLNGTISAAGGPEASCEFQYVTETAFAEHGFEGATSKSCPPPNQYSGSGQNAVSVVVNGLSVETTYRFRLVGTNENGSNNAASLSFTTGAPVNAVTTPATGLTGTGAQLNGTINPEGTSIEECFFEYGTDASYGSTVPCVETPGEIGSGNAPVSVHANVSSLSDGSEYHFRLAGKGSLGIGNGADQAFITLGPIFRAQPSVSSATETTATLKATIDPNGNETVYFFEYVSQADFEVGGFSGAAKVPVGGGTIVAGTVGIEVEQTAAGLSPGTAYRIRVTAQNTGGAAVSHEAIFVTYASSLAGLPDGRVYEQISPPGIVEKNGNPLLGDENNVLAAAADGRASTFYAVTGASETESAKVYPIYIATRGGTNWASEGVNPPASLGNKLKVLGYTENLTGTYSTAFTLGVKGGLYLRENGGHLLTIASDLESTDEAAAATFVAAESKGGGVVLFESPAALAEHAIAGVNNVYVWSKSSGELKLVDVLSGTGTPPTGASAGSWDYVSKEAVGGVSGRYYTETTLSEDGDRAFFTTANSHQIYLRIDPFSSSATTAMVSESEKTNGVDPNGPQHADFLGATPDGAFAFFKSGGKLTNDATTGEFDQGSDLYRYEAAGEPGERLVDLTPSTEAGGGARVLGLAGVSRDGSFAYFVARGQLAPGAQEGGRNLYAWHEGQVRLVAVLGNEPPEEEIWLGTRIVFGNLRAQRQARVSVDGRTIIFASTALIPGTAANGEPQIFRYSYGNKVECISCNPTGIVGEGRAALQRTPQTFIKPSVASSRMTRNLSPDGQRVFFETAQPLVAGDINGVEDAYEWEADGKGSCHSSSQNGGCLYLVSTGTSPEPAYFSDASVSGDDVFFFTTQSLVGQDTDDLADVYDARVGGGLPAQNPIPVVPCETGLACHGPGRQAPDGTSPSSDSFVGPETEKPKACKKGFVRKGEHCVKKHKAKHKKNKHKKSKHGHKNGGQR